MAHFYLNKKELKAYQRLNANYNKENPQNKEDLFLFTHTLMEEHNLLQRLIHMLGYQHKQSKMKKLKEKLFIKPFNVVVKKDDLQQQCLQSFKDKKIVIQM